MTKLLNDYSSFVSEDKHKVKYGRKKIKILTPEQIFQKLPIAVAQVKAGKTSENLLKIHIFFALS